MSVKLAVMDTRVHDGTQDNQHVLRKSNWRPSSSASAAARSKSVSHGPSSSSNSNNNSKKREAAMEPRTLVSFADARPQEEKVEEHSFEPAHPKTPPRSAQRVSKKRFPNGSSPGGANVPGKENNEPPVAPTPAKVLVTPPENSQKASLLQRLSGRLSGKPGFVKMASVGKEAFENMGGGAEEEDPVMTIFENRNTRRIRFTLEGRVSERGFPKVFLTTEEEQEKQSQNAASSLSIKQFMSRALFGGTSHGTKSSSSSGHHNKAPLDNEEIRREAEKEMGQSDDASLVWESAATPMGPEVIHTQNNHSQKSGGATSELLLSFTENPKARAQVVKILNKARRAQHNHFRYEYAVKCYVKVLDILTKANYPDDHPTVQKTMRLLNNSHHVLSSYTNSANIVKMGIKFEDAGELVRALKMYTIAYRIRRDNLSRNHPSLVVLLNMLGSIQMKRNELKEAMQIYELALRDAPVIFSARHDEDEEELEAPTVNLMAKSVTYREMGTVYERWGMFDEALNNFHKSLECVEEWKKMMEVGGGKRSIPRLSHEDDGVTGDNHYSFSNINLSLSAHHAEECIPGEDPGAEKGEMELHLASASVRKSKNLYESFFPPHLEELLDKDGEIAKSGRDDYADVDLALTLHQIAQLHRCQGHFADALNAYEVALRGMKFALGKHHQNVAAVLGNIGNLQKEMGDLDGAHRTYQEVLGIESYRLGLGHPDVAITLHNIATIDAARGKYAHALTLYRKVITLQKKLFGDDNFSVAVTAACMGDVYERTGELLSAMESFEEAARIKSVAVGRHSLDVARLLHKLGKIAFARHDYHMAESYISRAMLIYRLHKLDDDHEWVIDANRDTADIDGAIAMGGGRVFEC